MPNLLFLTDEEMRHVEDALVDYREQVWADKTDARLAKSACSRVLRKIDALGILKKGEKRK